MHVFIIYYMFLHLSEMNDQLRYSFCSFANLVKENKNRCCHLYIQGHILVMDLNTLYMPGSTLQ